MESEIDIARLKAGHEWEFRLAVEILVPRLRATLYSWAADVHDIDDIVQETMCLLYKTRDRIRATDTRGLTWYVVRIARNVFFEHSRAAARRKAEVLAETEDTPAAVSMEEVEELEAINRAISQLSERERDVLYRYFVGSESIQSIAASLNMASRTVVEDKRRAVDAIRRGLSDKDPSSHERSEETE